MRIDAAIIVTAIILVQTALVLALPSLSRKDILFSVTVGAPFRSTAVARRAIRLYRELVVAAALVTLALFATTPQGWRVALAFANLAAVAGAWMVGRSMVTRHALPPSPERVASLAPRPSGLPGGVLVAAGPFLILALSALYVWMNWDRIPDRFARHWSGGGTPNGWSHKSVGSVFGPLLFGVLATAVATFSTWSLFARTRQIAPSGDAAIAERRYKRINVLGSQAGCYLMAIVFSTAAMRPALTSSDDPGALPWVLIGAIAIFTLIMLALSVRYGQGGARTIPEGASGSVVGDATPDDGWILGMIYFNPADPALFVEKRMGLGWTLNFGRKVSWLILALIVSPVFWLPRLLR